MKDAITIGVLTLLFYVVIAPLGIFWAAYWGVTALRWMGVGI